jgi:hypothetical protein
MVILFAVVTPRKSSASQHGASKIIYQGFLAEWQLLKERLFPTAAPRNGCLQTADLLIGDGFQAPPYFPNGS